MHKPHVRCCLCRLEWRTHLVVKAMANLSLDNPVFNAHTSGVDALWAGLPLLTTPGQTMSSRVAASLLLSGPPAASTLVCLPPPPPRFVFLGSALVSLSRSPSPPAPLFRQASALRVS